MNSPLVRYGLSVLALVLASAAIISCSTAPTVTADLELSEQPLTGKFVWHDLITDDVDRARSFYGALFGWKFETADRPDVGDYTLIVANGRYIGGMVELDDPDGQEYSRWLGYLSVEDVDRAVEVTRTSGGEVVVPPRDLPIARAAAIRDPHGAVIGIVRSHSGDPVDREPRDRGDVVWNELLTVDPQSMAVFYNVLAGLKVREESMETGIYYYLGSQGRNRAGMFERPNEDIQPVWLTHFSVPDAAAAARQVTGLGGRVLLEAAPDLRDGTLSVVADPSGALLALHRIHERRAP